MFYFFKSLHLRCNTVSQSHVDDLGEHVVNSFAHKQKTAMTSVEHNRILNICWGNNQNCSHHCFPYTYCSFYGCFYIWFRHLSWFNSIVHWGPQYVIIRVNTSSSCLPLKLGNDFHCYWSVCPFGFTSKSHTERCSRFSAANSLQEMWRMWAENSNLFWDKQLWEIHYTVCVTGNIEDANYLPSKADCFHTNCKLYWS